MQIIDIKLIKLRKDNAMQSNKRVYTHSKTRVVSFVLIHGFYL